MTRRDQKRMAGTHAIVMAIPDGVIQHWDAGEELRFGYSAEEALGQSLDLIVPVDFRERHWVGFRSAVATGGFRGALRSNRSFVSMPPNPWRGVSLAVNSMGGVRHDDHRS